MAAVVKGRARTVVPVGAICGSKVTGLGGVALGSIEELMVEAGTGLICYAALARGGVIGIGERLYAVPWRCFVVDPLDGAYSLALTVEDLEERPGFDKDAWPEGPDEELAARCGRT